MRSLWRSPRLPLPVQSALSHGGGQRLEEQITDLFVAPSATLHGRHREADFGHFSATDHVENRAGDPACGERRCRSHCGHPENRG